jgi:hypothetical protein
VRRDGEEFDAHRCLRIFLDLFRMQCPAEAEGRRLLCVLQLRRCGLSAGPGKPPLLQMTWQLTLHPHAAGVVITIIGMGISAFAQNQN